MTATDRVRAFLDAHAKMGGPFDKTRIARVGVDGGEYDLTVADLRELLAERADSPPTSDQVAEVTGTVRHSYSDSDECICCPGRHVYARGIEGVDLAVAGWLHQQVRGLPDGMPVRIAVFAERADSPPTDDAPDRGATT